MDFLSKTDIRKFMLSKRDSIDAQQKRIWDDKIFEAIIGSDFYKKANMIFTFVSFKSEVDTHKLINHAINEKKVICVPRIKSKQAGIEVFKINDLADLETGYFGVPEPMECCHPVDIRDIDLTIMPGLAFDREGGRVGYGGGFYDRFLMKMERRLYKIAPAYEFQLLDKVPMDDWDIPIDGIVTEQELIFINNMGGP